LAVFVSRCGVKTCVFWECGIVDLVVAGSSPVAIAISKSCHSNDLGCIHFCQPIRFSVPTLRAAWDDSPRPAKARPWSEDVRCGCRISGRAGCLRREERQLERFHQQLERDDLLVLDELGYVPRTKAGAELLFEVVSRAYKRTRLLVTTNLPFENWTEVLGTERLTGALLDRLTHRIHILEANGESYRQRESRRRLRQRPASRANETEA
jgi:hypothetical protein